MGTDIINKIEGLNLRSFSDYQYLAFNIRREINDYAMANQEKLKIDNDNEGFNLRANSLDYIGSIFNKKLSEFISTFFYNDELIRDVIKQDNKILDLIRVDQFRYFHHIIGQNNQFIGRITEGPDSIDKAISISKSFNINYKSGYYTQPKPKNSEGCFVATFAYESYNHENVLVLRKIRDEVLAKWTFGRYFILKYYQYSPSLVSLLERIKFPKKIIRKLINWLVISLKIWMIATPNEIMKNCEQ